MQRVESIEAIFCKDFEKLKNLSIDQLKECDSMGRNVFHAICNQPDAKMMKYLIDKFGVTTRIYANAGDNTGNTPSDYACGKIWEDPKYWEKNE